MKTKTLAIAFTLLALLAGAPRAGAQGTTITYQGRLNDGASPPTGVYDLRFELFDALSGGAQVGPTLTNSPTAVSDGLFTVTLNFGAGVFSGAARWLEIAARTNGGGAFTLLTPRQRITAAPYAITAGNVTGNVAAGQLTGTIAPARIGAGTVTSTMLATGAVGSNQLAAGAVTTGALADGAVTAPKVATVSNWFALTIPNPTPQFGDQFGISMAAVGSDRVLIGAHQDDTGATNAGAAYLFSTDGTLLTTFNNPTPMVFEEFGNSVAAMGNDRVLIGAHRHNAGGFFETGATYLFGTNGTLLATFNNPTPANGDRFGVAVAAVGSDRVLIGANGESTVATAAGAAYLFNTNGTLMMTFLNPTPQIGDWFGITVAAVGSDRVLIGAWSDDTGATDAGSAYLFSTNGTLLMTFPNPTPQTADLFGFSVAAVGSDRVLIGASQDDTGATDAGAAYLFSTNGTLLTTFTKPSPADADQFGHSVAAVGSDRVLIGARFDDMGATDAGAAYLFSTNGTLVTTFPNPTPAFRDYFANSVVAVGSDRVLIGANQDDTGATDAGAAYLFSTESFTDGLVADAVRARSVTTANLEDGAVTAAKLDSSIGVWTRSGDNVFRPTGNVGIGTSSFTSNRLEVAGMVGATTFNTTSDRAAKENFTPVDAAAVLAKVAAMPITQWSFKELPGARHVGPMAQDFHAAFGLGHDAKSIATVDADGVALAAIQGLNQKLTEELKRRDRENADLKQRLEKLERLMNLQSGGSR